MRVPLTTAAISPIFRATNPASFARNLEIEVVERDTETKVTVYSAEIGGGTLAQPLTTDEGGRIEGQGGEETWVEEASLDLLVNGQRVPWEPGRRTLDAMEDVAPAFADRDILQRKEGAWIAARGIEVRPEFYGAVGDDSEASIAANDIAIAEACEVAEEKEGTVVFGPGTFRYSVMPELNGNKLHLRGSGVGMTTLRPVGCKAFRFHGDNWTAMDFTIDGSLGGEGLTWGGGTFAKIIRVRAENVTGHGFSGDGTFSYNNMQFVEVDARDCTGCGIKTVGEGGLSNNCKYIRCQLQQNGEYGLWTNGVSVHSSGGWYSENAIHGIKTEGTGCEFWGPLVEANGTNKGQRKDSTAYAVGACIHSTDEVTNPYTWICIKAGTSGTGEPAWPTTAGKTVVDGTVEWMNNGTNTEGQSHGAGVDDRGSSRTLVVYGNSTNQGLLRAGNNVSMVIGSGGGGSVSITAGLSGSGRLGGINLQGKSITPLAGNVASSNVDLEIGGTGTGLLKLTGAVKHTGTKLGFFNNSEKEKRTVTGVRRGGPALTSLMAALNGFGYGQVADTTTAPSQTIASAATIAPEDGLVLAKITGTTEIKKITATSDGHSLILKFAEALTIKEGENLKFGGEAKANEAWQVVCDGTNWFRVK